MTAIPRPLVLAVDVGGTRTKLGWIDPEGTPWALDAFPTPAQETPEVLIQRCLQAGEQLWKTLPIAATRAGTGVGIPNAREETGEVVHPPHLAWGRVPLRDLWQRRSPLPTVVLNDATAALLAEHAYGSHRGAPHLLAVTIGTGLGSGLMVGGQVVSGANGLAPELGHLPIPPANRPCSCGRWGCLETHVSESGVTRTYRELGGLLDDPTAGNAREVHRRALQGERLALEAWSVTGRQLALGLCPAILLAGPAHIVCSGGVSQAGELLLQPAREELDRLLMPHFAASFTLEQSVLEAEEAGVLGAAAAFWRAFPPPPPR